MVRAGLSIVSASTITEGISFTSLEYSGILTTFRFLEDFWKIFFSLFVSFLEVESLKDMGVSAIEGFELSFESLLTGVSFREITSVDALPPFKA
jgi:hypothetical protein